MLGLLLALTVPPAQSGGATAQDARVIVAYHHSGFPLPRLPREFVFPASLEQVKKQFPSERYVVRTAEQRVTLVVDKRVTWIKSRLDGAILLRELAKRPNPFAAVQISQLSAEGQEAAIGFIDMVQPKALRAITDKELTQASIALTLALYVTNPESGRGYAPALPLLGTDEENKAVRDQLLAHPVTPRTPTAQDIAALENAPVDVVVRQYAGNPADTANYLLSAAKEFAILVEELKREKESAVSALNLAIERLFGNYLGGLRFGSTARLSTSEGPGRRHYETSFLANWQMNGFASKDEAQVFLQQDQPLKINPFLSLQWARGVSATGTPSFVEVELYRGR